MYARYTEFHFDPADRDAVLRFWETVALPSASRQPGWRAAYVLESEDAEPDTGVLRTFTVWDAPADFERYRSSEEHVTLGEGIRDSGLRTSARDGLTVHHAATPPGSLVRITRGSVDPAQADAVADWWRSEGKPLTAGAPGCLRADAYWSEPGRFELVVQWTDPEAAKAFLEGPLHARFKTAMDGLGCSVVERIVGDRIT